MKRISPLFALALAIGVTTATHASASTKNATNAPPTRIPVDRKSIDCSINYAKYQVGSDTPVESWTKPLNYDETTANFTINLTSTPLTGVMNLDLTVHPYFLTTTPRYHETGIFVEMNLNSLETDVEANYRNFRPSVRTGNDRFITGCNFSIGWHEGFKTETTKGAKHLVLSCHAPIEVCEFSPQD